MAGYELTVKFETWLNLKICCDNTFIYYLFTYAYICTCVYMNSAPTQIQAPTHTLIYTQYRYNYIILLT